MQPPHEPKPSPKHVVSSADTKKFGFENVRWPIIHLVTRSDCFFQFGNTWCACLCDFLIMFLLFLPSYANSVLQALYFCAPFRDLIIQTVDPSLSREPPPAATIDLQKPAFSQQPLIPVRRKPDRKGSLIDNPPDSLSTTLQPPYPIPTSPPTLFSALRSLFLYISTHPGDKGTVAPKAFIDKLKESKEDFRGTMHQDAHEFLNHLLNTVVEELEEDRKSAQNSAQVEDCEFNWILYFVLPKHYLHFFSDLFPGNTGFQSTSYNCYGNGQFEFRNPTTRCHTGPPTLRGCSNQ